LCGGLIVLLAYLQIDQFANDRRIQDRVARTLAAETSLYRLMSLLQDIETGQRGYVLTGDPDFLDPYVAARAGVRASLAAVRRSLSDSPESRRRTADLARLTQRKLAFAARAVALRDEAGPESAARLVASGEGRAIMEQVRSLVGRSVSSEREQLAQLRRSANRARAQVQLLSAVLQLFLAGLLALAFMAYVRQIRRHMILTNQARDDGARLAAIFTAATDSMLILDAEGRIETANPAAERLFGAGPAELAGRHVADLFARRPREATIRTLLRRRVTRQGSRGSPLQQFTGRRGDGSSFEADVATSAVELADGTWFLLVIRDATERRRVERLKSEFVSTVSHELRTPLTSIAGSLGLVAAGAAGPLEPRAAKLIGIALNNSQRLVRLINDILDIEKIESGKMTFDMRRYNLPALVEEAVQATEGFAAEKRVSIAISCGGARAIVLADHDRLIQVLTNLLSNAIKFSPEHGVVEVALTPSIKRHRITVRDRGPGIPPEFQQSLFTRFAQADSSDTRSKGGTGLGLAIVKEILDRTGGEIGYETSPDGTAFHVELPAQPDQRRRGVLLVQVEDPVVREIRDALATRGMEADQIKDTSELDAAAGRRTYDAVIVGLRPGGREAAATVQAIRSCPSLATTPILASAPSSEDGELSQALTVVDWLDEPPTPVAVARGTRIVRPGNGREGLRVLHIEDDEDIARLVASAFEDKAIVTAVQTAEEARRALAAETPDLVILDLALPDASGLELLPSLRKQDGEPFPVVIYTARDDDADIASQALAVLTKSKASLDDLVTTVLRIVHERETGAS
ncbi:MAG: CHASE3 domain-containing protein, partial [Novosphingobium sp.]